MTAPTPRRASSFATAPYPGEVPQWSYCLDRGVVHRLEPAGEDYALADGTPLTTWLAARDAHLVPLLTYGSNASPGRLAEKFGADVDGIACLRGSLTGVLRVLSAQISSRGTRPVTLVALPEASAPVHLLVLPSQHAPAMDSTEGRPGPFYELCRLVDRDLVLPLAPPVVWRRPLAYVGHAERGPLLHAGRPVAVDPQEQPSLDGQPARGGDPDAWLPARERVDDRTPLAEVPDPHADAALACWLWPRRAASTATP